MELDVDVGVPNPGPGRMKHLYKECKESTPNSLFSIHMLQDCLLAGWGQLAVLS